MSLCESCGKGQIVSKEIPNFKVVLSGIKRDVPTAKILECNVCHQEIWPNKEVYRWSKLPAWVSNKKKFNAA